MKTEAPPSPRRFEDVYSSARGDLFRALVLTTVDPDVAVEAVDRGFARWAGRLRGDAEPAEPAVLGEAYRWVRKRTKRRNQRVGGFRRRNPMDRDAASALAAFRELSLDDRIALVVKHQLQWDDDRLGTVIGLSADDAGALAMSAEGRLQKRSASLDLLASAFAAQAGELHEPLERAGSARRRGMLLRYSRIAAAGAAVAALATTATVAVFRGEPSPEPTPSSVPGSAQVIASGTIVDLEWVQSGVPIEQGDVTALVHTEDGFLLLGNDYTGRFGAAPVALRSDDGVSWEQLASPPVGNGWIQSLEFFGDDLVAVGSTAGNGRDVPTVWISSDGLEWVTSELPVDTQVEIEGATYNVYTWVSGVSSSKDELTVIGTMSTDVDLQQLVADRLPEGVTLDNGWGTSQDGVEFYDNSGQVVGRATWAELGIPRELARLMSGESSVLWVTKDGTTWEQQQLDVDVPRGRSVAGLAGVGEVTAALVYGPFSTELWLEGGEGWQRASIPEGRVVTSMVSVGETLYVAGTDASSAGAVWSTTDGVTWEKVAATDGPGHVTRLSRNDEGVLAMVQHAEDLAGIGPAVVEKDGLTIEITQDGMHRVLEDGEEVVTVFGADLVTNDDGSVTILDDDGSDLVLLTQDEVQRAWERYYERGLDPGETSAPGILLLASDDGETWVTIDVGAGIGDGYYPMAAAWADGIAIFAGSREGGFIEDGGPGVSIWVGTRP
ncbi:MAG TPA: hypothetical protein VGC47_07145 [Acidimicrobiia bacterium]